jgi:hypothetical protein
LEAWIGQLIAFLLGLVGNFIASAIYEKYKEGRSRHAAAIRAQEDEWRRRLSSADQDVRSRAFQDILMRILLWYLLGNVMFGISGLGWLVDFLRIYTVSNLVAAGSSLIAVVMFGMALSWVKRYMKYA